MRGVLGGLVVLVSLVMWNENLGAPPVRAAQRMDRPAPAWTLRDRADASSTASGGASTALAQQAPSGGASRAEEMRGAGEGGGRARGARPRGRQGTTPERRPGARTTRGAKGAVRASGDAGARTRRRGKVLTGTLNINTADARHLAMLPGIGPATARRIIETRARRPFRKPAHLRRVRGIGKKKYNKIKRFVVVRGESTLRVWSPGEVGR